MKRVLADKLAALWRCRSGVAMTETALLCFYVYVPILLMVIVWGDISLDKEQAHIAGAYMGFSSPSIQEAELAGLFFPGATGRSDATLSVRQVGVLRDDLYGAPDYTAMGPGAPDPEMDVQAKLFGMAVGEIWSSVGSRFGPGGEWEMTATLRRRMDEAARYLLQNEIVGSFSLPDEIEIPVGGSFRWSTGSGAASNPTDYALAATRILNGYWEGGRVAAGKDAPFWRSEAGLWTHFNSPYLQELARYTDGRRAREMDIGSAPGQSGIRMQFGRFSGEPKDDTFLTGYAYIFNRGVLAYDPPRLMLCDASTELFGRGDGAMESMSIPFSDENTREDDRVYHVPGDPRER